MSSYSGAARRTMRAPASGPSVTGAPEGRVVNDQPFLQRLDGDAVVRDPWLPRAAAAEGPLEPDPVAARRVVDELVLRVLERRKHLAVVALDRRPALPRLVQGRVLHQGGVGVEGRHLPGVVGHPGR